jgi:hypothetical protein
MEVVEVILKGIIITWCTQLLKVFETGDTILFTNLRDKTSKDTVGVLVNSG